VFSLFFCDYASSKSLFKGHQSQVAKELTRKARILTINICSVVNADPSTLHTRERELISNVGTAKRSFPACPDVVTVFTATLSKQKNHIIGRKAKKQWIKCQNKKKNILHSYRGASGIIIEISAIQEHFRIMIVNGATIL